MHPNLRRELQQLSPEELRAVLSASGHGQLLRQAEEGEVDHEADEQTAAAAKDEGNACFRQGRMQDAVAAYSRCIEMSPRNAVCLSNRALAYLKLKQFDLAIADCSNAIVLERTIKPLMRRATAYIALQQFDSAVDDLGAALEFESRNSECRAKLETIVDHATKVKRSVDGDAIAKLRRAGIRAAMMISVRDGWSQSAVRGNPGPAAVNGHTLFQGENGLIYLFGGRAVREQKPRVFVQDKDDESSWDILPVRGSDVPSSRAWHSTSAIGDVGKGCYCIYGGVSSRGEDPKVHLLVPASPRGFEWVLPHTLQDPKQAAAPRSGHAAVSVAVEGKDSRVVYIFGGRTKQGVSNQLLLLRSSSPASSSTTDTNASFDQQHPLLIEWEELGPRKQEAKSNWPCARDGHSMCLLDGSDAQAPRLIVFGGNGQSNDEKMNDVWLFDLKEQYWTSLQCSGELPAPRSYHTAHIIDEFLFVVGGRTLDSEDDSVYMLDTTTSEWFKVPIPKDHALNPRAWHSSVLTKDGKLFVLGGGTYHGPLKDAASLDLSYFQAKASRLIHADVK